MDMNPHFAIQSLNIGEGDAPGYRTCSVSIPGVDALLARHSGATLIRDMLLGLGIQRDGATDFKITDVVDDPREIARATTLLQSWALFAASLGDLPETRETQQAQAHEQTWKGTAFAASRTKHDQARVTTLFEQLSELGFKPREISATSFVVMRAGREASYGQRWCKSIGQLQELLERKTQLLAEPKASA